MRKIFIGLVVFGVLCCIVTLSYADYIIYGDSWSVYPSGYIGGPPFFGSSLTLDASCPDTPWNGTKCTKVTYDKDKEGWAGIVCHASYQPEPPNHDMCLNLTGFNKLSFRAKAAIDNTQLTFWMGSDNRDFDSCGDYNVLPKPSVLTTDWEEFSIDLPGGEGMSYINTVFAFVIGGNASITNPVTFYIDDVRYLGLTITDFVALTGFHKGEIDLTWTAPTGEGDVTEYIVKYSNDPILTPDDFDSATTYEQEEKWEPELPGIAEKHILKGLKPGTFYYVAIKAKDQSENSGNVSNTKGNYAMARAQVIGISIEGSYDFGGIDAGEKIVSNRCFLVKNIGEETLTYSLNLTNPTPWRAVQSEPTGHNTYILNAMFNSLEQQPSSGDFNENQHALSTKPVECGHSGTGKFAGDEDGEEGINFSPGDTRYLWVQFKAPQTTSVRCQEISIYVTVQSP